MVRTRSWLLAALALGQAGCGWFDFSGSRFECDDAGSCPTGLICSQGYCIELLTGGSSGGIAESCGDTQPAPGACGQLCDDCAATNCCSGLVCGTSYACLVAADQPCSQSSDCASGSCAAGTCACSALEGACGASSDCCAGLYCAYGTCRRPGGSPCTSLENCTTEACTGGVCACNQTYEECVVDADCCDGNCMPPSGTTGFGACD